MDLNPKKLFGLCVAGFVSICIVFLTVSSFAVTEAPLSSRHMYQSQSLLKQPDLPKTRFSQDNVSSTAIDWEFDPLRDGKNYGLSEAQCDAAFPKYWVEIARAKNYWQSSTGPEITEEDLSLDWRKDELVRAMIFNRQLYIVDTKWAKTGFDKPRAVAILASIYRAIIAYPGDIPNIEFTFCLGDASFDDGTHPLWALTRKTTEDNIWVMPDFGYWSWSNALIGEYTDIQTDISLNEPEWNDKIDEVIWRGNPNTNTVRKALIKATKDKDWADIKEMKWSAEPKDFKTLPEHCNYKYVIHTEGNSYSGRAKYLLNCRSVFITHDLDWIEPHTHLLFVTDGAEGQNSVLVNRNFTDLESAMQNLMQDQEKAQRIAENVVETFRDRYLTPAAQACYWRKLFTAWSEVSFEPKLFAEKQVDGKVEWERRGIPYELFLAHGFELIGGAKRA